MIPIVIIGEVDLVRGSLAAMLAHEDDLDVASVLPPREDVAAAVRHHRPAVVVIDIDRCREVGLEAARQLVADQPECRVLLLASRQPAAVLRRALAAQVSGLASPDIAPEQLAQSIRLVAAGERVIDPALAAAALQPAASPLTERERAVLLLAADGLRAPEIAERLFLSPGTVRNHLSAALRKSGARNRLEAVRRARGRGWI